MSIYICLITPTGLFLPCYRIIAVALRMLLSEGCGVQ